MIGDNTTDGTGEGAIYGRITYFFDTPNRMDCSRLYEIEIQILRDELELLRRENEYRIQ